MDFPNDENGSVLARMAATGMDMSKPIPMRFAIESRNEDMSEVVSQF